MTLSYSVRDIQVTQIMELLDQEIAFYRAEARLTWNPITWIGNGRATAKLMALLELKVSIERHILIFKITP